jgi:sortase (surface protein transpeptidase)
VVAASIDVDVPVVPVGVEQGGFMELPENPATAGWYRFGADPTSPDGNTVISAHVDAPEYPIGPFSRLRDLVPGETVEVTDTSGTVHQYTVGSVTYYPKADLPVDELFARAGTRSLVLITCGGDFDSTTGRYADNVVAIAAPAT